MSRHMELKINLMPGPRSQLWRWKSLFIVFAFVFPFSPLFTQQARGDDLAIFSKIASAFDNLATTFLPVSKDVAAKKFNGVIYTFNNNYKPTNSQVTAGSLVSTLPQASSARGEILLTGGIGNNGIIGLVDIYNPVTATWLSAGNLTTGLSANETKSRFNVRALLWCSIIVAF